jgi:DNA-binding transcriptional ArsR family regulator
MDLCYDKQNTSISGNISIYGIISNNENVVKELSMPSRKADLLLHPVRLQIITAISTYRMTAKELAEALSDVPQTTLYRHINTLVEGGILIVVDEKQIRGTVERTYAMEVMPSLIAEDLEGMQKKDYEQILTMFISILMGDVMRYLNSKPEGQEINLLEDGFELSRVQLYMSDEEFKALNQKITELMIEIGKNEPTPDRKRRIFTYLGIPAAY